ASALAAALGVVVAIAVTPSTVDVRLDSLVPYAAAAGALLGLAETLAHLRARRGFSITVATIGTVAASVGVASTTGVSQAPGDIGTSAALAAAGTLAAALVVATATASPRPLVVDRPLERAVPGVAWLSVVALTACGLMLRLALVRPVW